MAARKIEPTLSISTSEVVSFKRDYEERAKELAEEIAEEVIEELGGDATALFSDNLAADAASAKAEMRRAYDAAVATPYPAAAGAFVDVQDVGNPRVEAF